MALNKFLYPKEREDQTKSAQGASRVYVALQYFIFLAIIWPFILWQNEVHL